MSGSVGFPRPPGIHPRSGGGLDRIRYSLLAVVSLLLLSEAEGGTKVVAPDCTPPCFATIQSAVDAAVHADTILVKPATYQEQVKIYAPAGDTMQFYLSLLPFDFDADPPRIGNCEFSP